MIDASRGFRKDGNKNRLREQDIHRIVDVFTRQLEVPRYSRMVPVAEIASPANDYNLNIPRYIDASEPEDLHDLDAHLNGGIPVRDVDALAPYWQVFPTLRETLFQKNGRDGYLDSRVPANQLRKTVLGHPEYSAFAVRVSAVFDGWRAAHEPALKGIKINDLPRKLIETLSEDLLARFAGLPLIDPYDVYQRLMDYWADVMQDDTYLIAADGWVEAARPRGLVENKAKKIKEAPDLVVNGRKYKMDLLPPALVIARHFAAEQAAIDALQATQEAAARDLEEVVEEHSGDEGLLAEVVADKGKVTKVAVRERLQALGQDAERSDHRGVADDADDDERETLLRCLALIEGESAAARAVNEAQEALDEQILARYGTLTETEIKTLVVGDKWFAGIRAAIDGEVQRLTQQLAGRVEELEERYAQPLPAMERDVEVLARRVEAHLRRMGLEWR
jgi:type I restriction enzyme M protein